MDENPYKSPKTEKPKREGKAPLGCLIATLMLGVLAFAFGIFGLVVGLMGYWLEGHELYGALSFGLFFLLGTGCIVRTVLLLRRYFKGPRERL